MKCKLCLKNKDLQDSHIIPNAFFRLIKDKKENVGKYIEVGNAGNKYAQNSYSEFMLCRECEQKFSTEFESYIIDLVLRNPKKIGVHSVRTSNNIIFENVDYNKLKLFQMSILWRAAVSELEFFSYVSLASELTELLRKNLYELTPLEPHVLPCFMDRLFIDVPNQHSPKQELQQSKSAIFNPKKTSIKKLSVEYITFVFGGFEWRFWLHQCNPYFIKENRIINKSGKLVCMIQDITSNELLQSAGVLARGNELNGRGIR